MSKKFVFAASTMALAALVIVPQTATAKSKSHKASAYKVGHNYFVPPPPPYSPTVLPLTNVMFNAEGEADTAEASEPTVQTPQSRWSKYIYVRQGYAAPHGVSANKYVTTWHKT